MKIELEDAIEAVRMAIYDVPDVVDDRPKRHSLVRAFGRARNALLNLADDDEPEADAAEEPYMMTASEAQQLVKTAMLGDGCWRQAGFEAVQAAYERVNKAFSERFARVHTAPATDEASPTCRPDRIEAAMRPLADCTEAGGPEDIRAETVLNALGLPVSRDAIDHVDVLLDALYVYFERDLTQGRGGVWRRSGVKGQVFHCFAKAERAFRQVMGHELPDRDHFIDLINYGAFAKRLLDEGSSSRVDTNKVLGGEWPWEG